MRTIHKHILDGPRIKTTLMLPTGAKAIHTALQDSLVTVWVECDPVAEGAERTFTVCSTGGELPQPAEYIGTVHGGGFVWHVYEITP